MSSNGEAQITGACFCKSVRFTMTGSPKACAFCHCTICQHVYGAPFTVACVCGPEQIKVTQGEDNMHQFKSSKWLTRYRCKTCASPLYSEMIRDEHHTMEVVVMALQRDQKGRPAGLSGGFNPSMHIWYSSRVMDVPDGLPKFKAGPDSEKMPEKEEEEERKETQC